MNAETVVTDDVTLNSLIEDELAESSSPDPHNIAEAVVGRIPEDTWRELVVSAITQLVKSRMRGRLTRVRRGDTRSVKWEEAVHEYRVFRTRVSVAGVWKFLGECNRADVAVLAEERTAKAEELRLAADGFTKLATLMKRKKVTVVGDLTAEDVERMLRVETE